MVQLRVRVPWDLADRASRLGLERDAVLRLALLEGLVVPERRSVVRRVGRS
jgi:hypothetical protein